MVPQDPMSQRQTTQRHRRSDRYLPQNPGGYGAVGQFPEMQMPSVYQQGYAPQGQSRTPQMENTGYMPVPGEFQQFQAGNTGYMPVSGNFQQSQAGNAGYMPVPGDFQQSQAGNTGYMPVAGDFQQSQAGNTGYMPVAGNPQPQLNGTSYYLPPMSGQAQTGQRMAMNGQPVPGMSQPGYGWEGAQSPYYGQTASGQSGWQQPYYPPYTQTPPDIEPPQPMPASSFPAGNERKKGLDTEPRRRIPWKMPLLIALLIALIIGGAMGIRAFLADQEVRKYVADYDAKFCQGVYVDGIHLGGMTQQEGVNAVTAQAQNRNNDWYVRLTYQGTVLWEINASQLGMRVDVIDVLQEAWKQGHEGDVYERQEAMRRLLEEPFNAYSAMPSGDTAVVDEILRQLQTSAYRAPQDAAILEFDPRKTNPFTFQQEQEGRMLNIDGLKETIYQMVSTMQSGDLELTLSAIAPNITVADLQSTVMLRADVNTEISTTSDQNRNENIRRAFELISGTMLAPGETFSFNGTVGRRTEANGFFPATEYAYGTEVQGIGGGVCQASTTMYIAAVSANLQITKHTPHSMQVGYTDYGRDATVSWEGSRQIDFAFKNNTDGYIYITAAVQQKSNKSQRLIARVRIYGMDMGPGVSYGLVAETIEEIPEPEPKYIDDVTGEHAYYIGEEVVDVKGRSGIKTQSYRVKYLNGKEVERTPLYQDTYDAKQSVIYRGIHEMPLATDF